MKTSPKFCGFCQYYSPLDNDPQLGDCMNRFCARMAWGKACFNFASVIKEFSRNDKVRNTVSGNEGVICEEPDIRFNRVRVLYVQPNGIKSKRTWSKKHLEKV